VRRTSNSAAGAGGRGQAWLQPGRTYTVVIAIASGAEQPAPSTADRATAFATEQAPTRGCLSQPQRTRSGSAADLPAECSFPMRAGAPPALAFMERHSRLTMQGLALLAQRGTPSWTAPSHGKQESWWRLGLGDGAARPILVARWRSAPGDAQYPLFAAPGDAQYPLFAGFSKRPPTADCVAGCTVGVRFASAPRRAILSGSDTRPAYG
jgi:hypothetical protein